MRAIISFLLLSFGFAISISAQEIDEFLMRSAAGLETEQYGKCIDFCNRALELDEDFRIYLILAKAQSKTGSVDDALLSYKRASSLAKGSGDLGLAEIYSLRGETLRAVEHLKIHLESSYKRPESEIILNPAFDELQKREEWKKLWKEDWYTDLEEGISEALYLVENKRLEELKELNSSLSPVYRGEPALRYLQGIVSLVGGDYSSALDAFRESIEGGYSSPEIWANYIVALMEERNFPGAVAASENALSQFPAHTEFILKKVEANRRLGDRGRAIEDIKIYLELYPDSEEGLSMAGKVMSENGSYSEALKYLSRSINIYPGNPDHYINRGDIYSRTATWQYAISDYSMALDLKPTDGDVYYSKGLALLKLGKNEDACRDFRMALKYGNKKAASEINKNCIR